MNEKMQKLEELVSGLKFSFREGFPDRLMSRILELERSRSPAIQLSASISRLFYWVSVPGLAAAIAILLVLLLSGDFGPAGYKAQYTSAFTEFLNDYYYQLLK